MIVQEITGVQWKVEQIPAPAELKVLILIDPQAGHVWRIPFSAEVAKEVAAHLAGSGSLVVTRQMPASGPRANGGGHG